jgi:uncharacterized membrane protein
MNSVQHATPKIGISRTTLRYEFSRVVLDIAVFLVSLLLTTYYLLLTTPLAHAAGERIKAYSVHIDVQQDGSAQVQEEIYYDFGTEGEHHGIFRKIPLSFRLEGDPTERSLTLSSISVTDENGSFIPTNYDESINVATMKIGDPNVLVSGQQVYVIRYTAWGAVSRLSDRDEFYWGATGTEWPSPIDKARVEVVFPSQYPSESVTAFCYRGAYGSTDKCDSSTLYEMPDTKAIGKVRFEQSGLDPYQGLTIAIGIPRGALALDEGAKTLGREYTSLGIRRFWQDPFIDFSLLAPIVVFALMFRQWWKHGRDPKGRGTIVPEYEIPENLSPLECSAMNSGTLTNAAISASIISLAERGYLRIEQVKVAGILWDGTDYLLTKQKEPDAKIALTDRFILDELFKTDRVKVSELAHKLVELKSLLNKTVFSELTERGYFVKDPQKVLATYFIAGLALVFIGMFLPFVNVAMIASGVIVLGFSWLMPQMSPVGAYIKERLAGFHDYLETAEGDRIRFHNAPDMKPEMFEKFLPYAMVFGIEEEWAQKFVNMFTPEQKNQPKWYGGSSASAFSASAFAADMGKFSSSTAAAFVSSSSGGSHGGGFSGGGAGGGGGGSR